MKVVNVYIHSVQNSGGRIGGPGSGHPGTMRRQNLDNLQMASTASNVRPARPPSVIVDGNVGNGGRKCGVCKKLCNSVFFSTIGIGTVLVGYILCGALVFNSLEGVRHEGKILRDKGVNPV
jgi:hypothetical protein